MYFKNLPSKKTYGDYFRVVKRPISLGQIQKRIKDGKYPQWSEFEEDVFLIKRNALQYNAEKSDVVKDACEMEVCWPSMFVSLDGMLIMLSRNTLPND